MAFIPGPISNILRKLQLLILGMAHLLFSRDSKWAKASVLDSDAIKGRAEHSVRIVFIRHGESEWNQVFNKGFGFGFLVRLLRALIGELLRFATRDSLFIDSPLSAEGAVQANRLRNFLRSRGVGAAAGAGDPDAVKQILPILNGESGHKSIVVASNLRRASATLLLALLHRLSSSSASKSSGGSAAAAAASSGEKIRVLSCLQEVSRNIDTLSLARPGESPEMSSVASIARDEGGINDPSELFDAKESTGNKSLSSNGLTRMHEFAAWACKHSSDTTVIVGGHSLYFANFFNTFLPKSADFVGKKRKMVNCGVVSFILQQGAYNGKKMFRIEPESVQNVYGGFV